MRSKKAFLLSSLASLLLLAPSGAQAQRAPSDFTRDGVSELVFISLGRVLAWQPVEVSTGAKLPIGQIGVPGDNIILADWLGMGIPQMGVVRLDTRSNEIVWRIKDNTGASVERRFGQNGDTVLAGADFDGSGAADGVILHRKGRKLLWNITFDLLHGGSTIKEFAFASPGERYFFADPDGKGLRFGSLALSKKETKVRLLNPVTGARRVVKGLPGIRFAAKSITPTPVRAPNGHDAIVLVRSGKTQTFFAVLELKSKKKKLKWFSVPAKGDSVVGEFMPNAGYEIAIRGDGSVLIVNPFDRQERALETPNGILVDEININAMKKNGGSSPSPTPTTTPEEPPVSGGPVPQSLRDVCARVATFGPGQMLIKSEASDHINDIDPRASGYTVVCGSLCPRRLDSTPFFYENGETAGEVGYYGRFSGNGQPRLYGAAGDAPQHFASDIARRAATIGSGKLYLQMSAEETGEGTWCVEFNPTGRNGDV